jgi:hypothetical protein
MQLLWVVHLPLVQRSDQVLFLCVPYVSQLLDSLFLLGQLSPCCLVYNILSWFRRSIHLFSVLLLSLTNFQISWLYSVGNIYGFGMLQAMNDSFNAVAEKLCGPDLMVWTFFLVLKVIVFSSRSINLLQFKLYRWSKKIDQKVLVLQTQVRICCVLP